LAHADGISCPSPQQNTVSDKKRAQREEAFIAPAEQAAPTIEQRKKRSKDGEGEGEKKKRTRS
jgi:ribosomal RNA assembly protein